MTELDQDAARPGARLAAVALLALVAFGLALRLTGLSFSLPHLWEPDGHVLETQVAFAEHGPDHGPHDRFYGRYPHGIARLFALVDASAPPQPGPSLEEHLRAAAAPRERIRRFLAALSVLIVPATWLLARRFLARRPALLACGLVAASVLHLWFAQQTRPHGLSSAFALLAVVAALRLCERGDAASYALAGAAAILAVCSLQSGVAVLIPLCVAHVLRERGRTRRAGALLAGVFVALAASVRVFYPFLFEASHSAIDAGALDLEGLDLHMSGHRIELADLDGSGFAVVAGAFRNYEPLLFALGLAGAALLAVRWLRGERSGPRALLAPRAWSLQQRRLAVVLSYVVPYALVIGAYAHTYQRFALPLLPFLATFAAWALFELAASPRRRPSAALATTLAAALLLVQAFVAVKLVAIRRAPDTAARAAGWIATQLAPGADRIVHSPVLDLPILRTPAALATFPREAERTRAWIVYQRRLDGALARERGYDLRPIPIGDADTRPALASDPLDMLDALGAEVVVVEHFTSQLRPHNEWLRTGLQRQGRLVARFSPLLADAGDDLPLAYQDDYFERRAVWWWRVLLARSMGPVIEIYRLPPRAERTGR